MHALLKGIYIFQILLRFAKKGGSVPAQGTWEYLFKIPGVVPGGGHDDAWPLCGYALQLHNYINFVNIN